MRKDNLLTPKPRKVARIAAPAKPVAKAAKRTPVAGRERGTILAPPKAVVKRPTVAAKRLSALAGKTRRRV